MKFLLTIVFFLISVFAAFPQNPDYIFFKPEQENLPQGVMCIYEDKLGFIWIGTTQGLYLFDGSDFITYRYQSGNENSLCNNYITAVIEDDIGQIWVGTFGGLSRYDRKSDSFINYFHNSQDSSSICHDQIKDFLIDKQSRLWVASATGLNLYNPETNDFRQFTNYIPGNIKSGKNITGILEDVFGNLWIGTWNAGLIRFNLEKNEYLHFKHDENKPGSFRENQINALTFVSDSVIWIGHYSGGLASFNINTLKVDYSLYDNNSKLISPGIRAILVDHQKNIWITNESKLVQYQNKSGSFTDFKKYISNDGQLFPHRAQYIFEDRNNLIWVYSDEEGLMYCHPSANNFLEFYHILPFDFQGFKQNYVTSITEDSEGNMWFATFDDGIIKKYKNSEKTYRFLHNPENPQNTLSSNRVRHLMLDQSGLIWASTSNGITIINPDNNKIEYKISVPASGPDGLHHSFVNKVFQDSQENFWILQQEGLDFYNPKRITFKHFNQGDQGGFSHYKFSCVDEDDMGNLWFGTYNGLNRYNLETGEIKQYFHDPAAGNAISNSFIESVTFSREQGKLWVGTRDGLNLYNKETDSFISFSNLQGISSNFISGIINEDSLNLWLITDLGLSKFNLKTREVLNYGPADGLTTNVEAFYVAKDGKLFFGGVHENYYSFYPDNIKFNALAPAVYLVDFLLFNKSNPVSTSKKVTPLKENIFTVKELRLKYNENSFGFEFAALNYLFPEKNQYAYKLEGFDKEWNYTSYKRRYANYTNLSPGKYRLLVRASNNDGVWNNKGTTLTITIAPPYWKTTFAFVIYLLTLAFLIIVARYYTIKQTRLESSWEVEHLLREREEEAHKQRMTFFTNISHEFRTPLTLISGPLKQLVHFSKSMGWNSEINSYLGLIHRNVKRLTDLTNQLLDFRKIESGKMKLQICKGDLVQFVSKVTDAFKELAERKNLKITFISDNEEIIAFFDPDKVEKILLNLIANAVKFTFSGEITVRLRLFQPSGQGQERMAEISVEDTGIGIAEDQLQQIFSPFHQVEDSNIHKNEGTGLGLALVQSIVQLCKGEVRVSSKPGKGSTFTVLLPVDGQNSENLKLRSQNIEDYPESDFSADDLVFENASEVEDENQEKGIAKPLMLVVEDNEDMRLYIRKVCSANYQVLEAASGESGIKAAVENIPDIIISDLMMPGISGMELTKILKSDIRTSHIPVIILTAISSTDQKIEGLNLGADDYITKPFNEELLKARVENLLQSRRKLMKYYQQQIGSDSFPKTISSIHPSPVEVENIDEKFIARMLHIIEMHMGEADFGVDYLAREIGMESSTLYKKMMALIEMPPGEFIRDIRMKRASQLLAQKHLSISDISYMIGYDDPKYFSKVFKKHSGLSPSEFRLKINDINHSEG